jgi:sugar phosphate isomerase/epimerase
MSFDIQGKKMRNDIPIVSIGFEGCSLEDTLSGMGKTESKNIILCCIDGFVKHVIPEEMTKEEWESTKKLVQDSGLNFFGLFGHCNLSDNKDLEKLKKRMEYTRFMGGDYIDTNAGQKGTEEGFFNNLPEIIDLAEELNLTVGLETHGDMLETGKKAVNIFDKIKSERITLSYDPANVFFYTRGKTDPADDLDYIFDYIGMFHFKGVSVSEDKSKWGFPFVKDAVINYESIFEKLEKNNYVNMIALEIEERLRFEEGKNFTHDPVWPEMKTVNAYNHEIRYLKDKLYWLYP